MPALSSGGVARVGGSPEGVASREGSGGGTGGGGGAGGFASRQRSTMTSTSSGATLDGGPHVTKRFRSRIRSLSRPIRLAHLGLAGRRHRRLDDRVALGPDGDGRWRDRHVLALHLGLDPPEIVVRPIEIVDRLPVTGQIVERSVASGLVDLTLDPRLPRGLWRLALGHGSRLLFTVGWPIIGTMPQRFAPSTS